MAPSVDARSAVPRSEDFAPPTTNSSTDAQLDSIDEALQVASAGTQEASVDRGVEAGAEVRLDRDGTTAEQSSPSSYGWILLFGVTIFLGAFLLFQVQPILGKFILPWFGGSPGVWTTCMLFFQCLLFGGYAYAHLLSSRLKLSHQVVVHIALLTLAMLSLPITPGNGWKPTGEESPIGRIVLLLAFNVGIPYFLLSSTGPLLQSWLAQSKIIDKPYRLYSLSNVGSMLALLSFPFWFETAFSSSEQSSIWSFGFLVYGALCVIGAIGVGYIARRQQVASVLAVAKNPALTSLQSNVTDSEPSIPSAENQHSSAEASLTWDQRLQWIVLACLPSMMLLAITNQVCLDTAVIPFLWIAPLAIYLLSFILTFDSERWYNRRICVQLAVISFLAVFAAHKFMSTPPLWLDIVGNFTGLFFVCMVCHGELYASRPSNKYLTTFYLSMSFGGALGGLMIGLVAPNIFRGFYEYQLGILCSIIVFLGTYLRMNPVWKNEVKASTKWMLGLSLPVCLLIWFTFNGVSKESIYAVRNFYGVLNVMIGPDLENQRQVKKLVHGRIVHGTQFLEEGMEMVPTTYYSESSGVGHALNSLKDRPIRVGVVGLGAGTLATYGKEGDTYRFYEINPDVISLAEQHFTFLSDSKAKTETVLGDARLVLEREEPQQFDLFVLDAFSGDAIPVHLLTKEAMEIYRKHLKPDGKIAIHVSNLYFDLKPIIQGLADDQGFSYQFLFGKRLVAPEVYPSQWALLSPESQWLEQFAAYQDAPSTRKPVLWRDDRSNLFEALK